LTKLILGFIIGKVVVCISLVTRSEMCGKAEVKLATASGKANITLNSSLLVDERGWFRDNKQFLPIKKKVLLKHVYRRRFYAWLPIILKLSTVVFSREMSQRKFAGA